MHFGPSAYSERRVNTTSEITDFKRKSDIDAYGGKRKSEDEGSTTSLQETERVSNG